MTLHVVLDESLEDCARFGKISVEELKREFQELSSSEAGRARSEKKTKETTSYTTSHPILLLEFAVYRCLYPAFSSSSASQLPRSKVEEKDLILLLFKSMLLWDNLQLLSDTQSEFHKTSSASPTLIPPAPSSLETAAVSSASFVRLGPSLPLIATPITVHAVSETLSCSLLRSAHGNALPFSTFEKYACSCFRLAEQLEKKAASLRETIGLSRGEVIIAEGDASLSLLSSSSPSSSSSSAPSTGASTSSPLFASGEKESMGHGRVFLTSKALYFLGDPTLMNLMTPRVLSFTLEEEKNRVVTVASPSDDSGFGLSLFSLTRSLYLGTSPTSTKNALEGLGRGGERESVRGEGKGEKGSSRPTWVLDFLDFQLFSRDVWAVMISEVRAAHVFVREYSPVGGGEESERAQGEERGGSWGQGSGGNREEGGGEEHVLSLSTAAIRQMQVLLAMLGASPSHPSRLLPFLWAKEVMGGYLIEQTLALQIWGKEDAGKFHRARNQLTQFVRGLKSSAEGDEVTVGKKSELLDGAMKRHEEEGLVGKEDMVEADESRAGVDRGDVRAVGKEEEEEEEEEAVGRGGRTYKKRWMRCKSWKKKSSILFWKEREEEGIAFHSQPPPSHDSISRTHLQNEFVVGGRSRIQRAVEIARENEGLEDRAQESIKGSLLNDIPANIDLIVNLIEPVVGVGLLLADLVQWKRPLLSLTSAIFLLYLVNSQHLLLLPPISVLIFAFIIIGIRYVRKSKKGGGKGEGEQEGEVIVIKKRPQESPVANILLLKQSLDQILLLLQGINVVLLRCRTLLFSDVPQATDQLLIALFALSTVLFLVLVVLPFRLVASLAVIVLFSSNLHLGNGHHRIPQTQSVPHKLTRWWRLLPVPRVLLQE